MWTSTLPARALPKWTTPYSGLLNSTVAIAVAGTDAGRDQEVGEAVGQPVVLAVVQPPLAGDQGRLLWPAPGGAPQDLA